MNIGIILDNELNDDKRVLREIKILKGAGYEIFVLCFAFLKKPYKSIEGISISRIRISRRLKNLLFFLLNTIPLYEWLWSRKISNFIAANKINVLHVHDLYMSKSGWEGIKRSGVKIPMILDLHENYSYAVTTYNWTKGSIRRIISQPAKWKSKEKELLPYASKIIVLSDEFRDHLVSEYNFLSSERFCVLPNVPDMRQMEIFRDTGGKAPFDKKAALLLYFGVVAERRGIFDAIGCYKELIQKGYDSQFLIIGPVDKKDRKRFFDMISLPDIRDMITYIPWIDISELPSYLEISDICLAPFLKNPQHESGVANKIYDYMAGSRPIIASDCLPQQKLIEKYNCGLIYRTQQEFIEAIITLLTDESMRRSLGENGFRAIINDLNLEKIQKNLVDAYSSLLNK